MKVSRRFVVRFSFIKDATENYAVYFPSTFHRHIESIAFAPYVSDRVCVCECECAITQNTVLYCDWASAAWTQCTALLCSIQRFDCITYGKKWKNAEAQHKHMYKYIAEQQLVRAMWNCCSIFVSVTVSIVYGSSYHRFKWAYGNVGFFCNAFTLPFARISIFQLYFSTSRYYGIWK